MPDEQDTDLTIGAEVIKKQRRAEELLDEINELKDKIAWRLDRVEELNDEVDEMLPAEESVQE